MTKWVLLVDDEDIAADLVESYLRLLKAPVELTWKDKPEEALGCVTERAWDLIIVDIAFRLDAMRGVSLIREMHAGIHQHFGKDCVHRIVALTQLDLSEEEKARCLEAGAEAVLNKWPLKADMQRHLATWLGTGDGETASSLRRMSPRRSEFSLPGLLPAW